MALNVGVLQAVIRLKDNLSSGLDNAAKKLRKFGAKTQRIGKQLATSISLPIIGAAAGAIAASETMDKALRAITVGTGAAGQTLDGLKDSFLTVFQEVPQSADTVATVIADMNTILGATGPALENLTRAMLDGSRVMGVEAAPNGIKFARVLEQFKIPAEEGVAVLDMFFATSQKTGAGFDELISQAGTFSVVLKNVGFTLDESVALFGALSKGSIEVTRIMPGLNAAFRRWSDQGLDAKSMLVSTIEAMKGATREGESLNIATKAFGAEGASRLNDAVLEGKFNLEEMTRAMDGTAGAISRATLDNKTFSESLLILKNRSTAALAPFGKELKNALVGFMPIIEGIFKKLNSAGEAFGNLSPKARNMAIAAAAVAAALGPVLIAVGALTASVGAILPIVTGFVGGLALLASWPAVLAAAFVLLVLKVKPFRDLLFALVGLIKGAVLVAFDAVKWAVLKLANGIGKVIGVFARFIPGMDKAGGVMDGLTGIIEGATSKLDDLRGKTDESAEATEALAVEVEASTAAMVQAVPQIVSHSAQLGAATVAVTELTKAEQALQDRISGKNLQAEIASLNNVLVEMGGNAELTRAQKHRLGEQALKLSQTLGAELTPELKEAAAWMYKTTQLADDAAAMLEVTTSATDRNSLAVAAKTRNDRVSNLLIQNVTDSVALHTGALATNQTQSISVGEAMSALDGALGEASTAFSNLANIAGDSFGGLFKKAGLVIGKVQALSKTVKSVKSAFGSIKSLTGLFGKLTGSTTEAGGAASGLTKMLGSLSSGIGPMVIGLGVAAGAIALISKGFKSAADRASSYRDHIEKMNKAVAGSGTAAAEAANKVRRAVGEFGTGSTEFGGAARGYATGTGGRFVDFGRGTLTMLHGREAIVPAGTTGPSTDALAHEIKALRSDLRTDRTFQMQLIPKMLAATMQQQGAT